MVNATMLRGAQEQAGGDGSTNFQAGRDVHLHGLTYMEVKQIAIDTFKANALELRGIAQSVALARMEELTSEFFEKMRVEKPLGINSLADPDVATVLFEAQKEYARSGEEDLKKALIDLLAARAIESERNLRAIALNEAISSAAKLTERQRRGVAWVFFLRYTRSLAQNIDLFYSSLEQVATALGVEVPQRYVDYQHIEYVGAGTISINQLAFGDALSSGNEGVFTNGFAGGDVDGELLTRLREVNLIVPCLRNPENLQLNVLGTDDLTDRVKSAGLEDDLEAVSSLLSNGRLSSDVIAEEAVLRIPSLATLRESWDSSSSALRNLTLTSVGLALGHAYWARLTGDQAELSIWL